MFLLRRHRRFALWLALLAMCFGALAPTVSRAMASGASGADWVEICSAQGTKRVALGTQDTLVIDLDHCPYCTLDARGSAAPPPSMQSWLPPAVAEAVPQRFLSAARTAHPWCSAQPRAPPSHS